MYRKLFVVSVSRYAVRTNMPTIGPMATNRPWGDRSQFACIGKLLSSPYRDTRVQARKATMPTMATRATSFEIGPSLDPVWTQLMRPLGLRACKSLKTLVGPPGFEPGTSCTPSKRASQAAPRPEIDELLRERWPATTHNSCYRECLHLSVR